MEGEADISFALPLIRETCQLSCLVVCIDDIDIYISTAILFHHHQDHKTSKMKQTILTVLSLTSLAIAVPLMEPRAACAPVHIIAARASGEAPGAGIIGTLVSAVIEDSSQSISTSVVVYPATLANYASSSAAGTAALTAQLTAQVAACPSQKIVLVGYSQGAHVIGDTLGGGGGSGG